MSLRTPLCSLADRGLGDISRPTPRPGGGEGRAPTARRSLLGKHYEARWKLRPAPEARRRSGRRRTTDPDPASGRQHAESVLQVRGRVLSTEVTRCARSACTQSGDRLPDRRDPRPHCRAGLCGGRVPGSLLLLPLRTYLFATRSWETKPRDSTESPEPGTKSGAGASRVSCESHGSGGESGGVGWGGDSSAAARALPNGGSRGGARAEQQPGLAWRQRTHTNDKLALPVLYGGR